MLLSFYYLNIKHVSYSELLMPKKELAPNVNLTTSNVPDLLQISNSVSSAVNVENDLSGSVSMLKNVTRFLGSIFGFRKVIRSVDFLNFQATAFLKPSKSKTIGLIKLQNQSRIFQAFNTSFMTVLILVKIIASLFL
jgi:hypothetical protein